MYQQLKIPVSFYREGTVVDINYPFEEIAGSKLRPAIIMDYTEKQTRVILLKVTSQGIRTAYDYELKNPAEAGLNKTKTGSSVIRTNHILDIPGDMSCIKRGDLNREDWEEIQCRYEIAVARNDIEYVML